MAEAIPPHTWKSGVEAIAWNASEKYLSGRPIRALQEVIDQLDAVIPSLKIAERRLCYYNLGCALFFGTGLALAAKAAQPLWQKGTLVTNQKSLAYASVGSFALFAVAAKLRAPVKEAHDIMHAVVYDLPEFGVTLRMLEENSTGKALVKSWSVMGSIHSRAQHSTNVLTRAMTFAGLKKPEPIDPAK